MKRGFHSLLPVNAQVALMSAVKSNLNETIKKVESECANRFHNDATLHKRVFFDQPIGAMSSAKFVNAAPRNI
jgi:hypothetical protein